MPAEHDVEIETLLEKDDYIPLFEGDVVIGEFHVERLSLQEMIDQGVDLSDPANVNTFTFKTTLTFQQEPIPISWDTREGDIILDMNQDNVKPGGFGTTSHSGGGGGGPEDPKPDSNRKEKVVVSVIGPPEAPVIAVLTTTQSVSWMKSMYQATLTVANTADSKYVLEDSTAEIHLPEGVSLAALTWSGERTEERILIHEDKTTSKTLHFSGDTELIHLGLSDHLLKKAIERIEHIDPTRRIDLSCINNAHICCGEGICGACTKNLGVDHTVRLCKEQSDLYDYKKLL